jgi:hypothetical protein
MDLARHADAPAQEISLDPNRLIERPSESALSARAQRSIGPDSTAIMRRNYTAALLVSIRATGICECRIAARMRLWRYQHAGRMAGRIRRFSVAL